MMEDQVDRPSQGDQADRRFARNNGQDIWTRYWIVLVVNVVLILALATCIEVAAFMTGDADYLKKLFLMAVGFIAEMKLVKCARTLFKVLVFAKDMDELTKWLVDRVLPNLYAAAEWFMPLVRRVA